MVETHKEQETDSSAARSKLSSMLSTLTLLHLKKNKEPLFRRRILTLLRNHPVLASEAFGTRCRHMSNGLYPLWFAVFLNLKIETVKEIFAMHPAAVLEHGHSPHASHPFHSGCALGLIQAGPTLDFLLQENPSLLSQKDLLYKRIPLAIYAHHSGMYNRRNGGSSQGSFPQTIRRMLELSPKNGYDKGLLKWNCSDVIFRRLLKEKVDDETLEIIFGSPLLPAVLHFGVLLPTDVYGGCLSESQVKAISLILPQCEQLTLHTDMEQRAFEHLLRTLGTVDRDGGLKCSLMLPAAPAHALRQLLNNRRILKCLTLRRNTKSSDNEWDDDWLPATVDSASAQEAQGGLEELALDGFLFQKCETFLQFLLSPLAPNLLKMTNLAICNAMTWVPWQPVQSGGNLTQIRIQLRHPSCQQVASDLLLLPVIVSSLKEFEIEGDQHFCGVDITWALCDLLHQSQLQKVTIKGFTVNARSLSNALLATSVQSLRLDGCNFVGMWDSSPCVPTEAKTKEFILFAKQECQEWWNSLLRLLSCSPTLSTIWLRKQHSPFTDISQSVIDLLAQGKLETLKLDGNLTVDVGNISAALASDASLKELYIPRSLDTPEKLSCLVAVLEDHNYTIENVELWACMTSKEAKRLKYLTDLNIHGRGKAVSPACTRNEFVELLCDVNFSEREVGTKPDKPHPGFYILYGLLRLAPGLWCSADCPLPSG